MSPSPDLLTGLGAAFAIFLTAAGSAAGSVPAGVYAVKSCGLLAMVPIVQAGVLGVYGIIIAVILSRNMADVSTDKEGYKNLSAGLAVGFGCLASGFGMNRFLQAMLVDSSEQVPGGEPLIQGGAPRTQLRTPSRKFILVMIFFESIGLYGLIAALFLQA